MNNQPFPAELLRRHKAVNEKLKKFKRVLFKRFGPNVNEISDEFNQLAIEFKNASLHEYAAISWQNAAECEHLMENFHAEVDYLRRAARSYLEADKKLENCRIRSNDKSFNECALQCYDNAISLLNDSPMKLALIREMKMVNPSVDVTNGYVLPSHRIYDLEKAAEEDVRMKNFIGALDKRKEIFNNVTDRKLQHLYSDVIKRNELSRILLLLLIELPSSRQVESHTNLIQKYTTVPPQFQFAEELGLSKELFLCVSELVLECQKRNTSAIQAVLEQLFQFKSLSKDQCLLLQELNKKCDS